MRKLIIALGVMALAAPAFAASAPSSATYPDPNQHKRTVAAYSLDTAGRCHDRRGKLANASRCPKVCRDTTGKVVVCMRKAGGTQ